MVMMVINSGYYRITFTLLLSDFACRFCKRVGIADAVYCYPDLLTSPLLLRNLTAIHSHHANATSDCLCLEKIGDNLANPLWARHAGDESGRLFVAEQVSHACTS